MRGEYHISVAWAGRGTSYAYKVTDEGWETFHRELPLAEKHLSEAWNAHPERAEAAALMITLCMAGHGPSGTSAMTWFERAIAARTDCTEAYNRLRQALRPRWGGSLTALVELGLHGVANAADDSVAPIEFLYCLDRVLRDGDGDSSFISDPGIQDGVHRMLRALEGSPWLGPLRPLRQQLQCGVPRAR